MSDSAQVVGQQIARAILDYLAAHPDAADNAEGIARWWLAGLDTKVTVGEVEKQLAELHGRGLIDKQLLPDGRALYRARRSGVN